MGPGSPKHLLAGILILLGVLAGARPVLAVCGDGAIDPNSTEECDDGNTVSGDGCTALCGLEVFSDGCIASVSPGSNCTSKDLGFASFTILEILDGCTDPNDTFTARLRVEIKSQATARYDIGLWVNLDGTDALNGAS
ncbi:MAG: DUF4215 domain-containing protein, partial [Myxococcales bacterium]|nr:DUF4215 domain-containing protein [Myxococcales bacterium]